MKRCIVPVVPSVTTPSPVTCSRAGRWRGHWGAEQVTVQGLEIVDVRTEDNVILIRGSVPGPKNGLVLVRKQ